MDENNSVRKMRDEKLSTKIRRTKISSNTIGASFKCKQTSVVVGHEFISRLCTSSKTDFFLDTRVKIQVDQRGRSRFNYIVSGSVFYVWTRIILSTSYRDGGTGEGSSGGNLTPPPPTWKVWDRHYPHNFGEDYQYKKR